MGMITITCPRCREDFATDADTGTAQCPSCACRLLLKKRVQSTPNLDPAASAPGVGDALSKEDSFVGERPAQLKSGSGIAALRQGDQLLMRNQYEQALYVFRQAVKDTPEDYRAWWGLTTATLQHLRAYLENQRLARNVEPLQQVYSRQMASAPRSMERVRELAQEPFRTTLIESYEYECHDAATALQKARRVCKKNLRRHRNFGLRLMLVFIAILLIGCGITCALLLPLELPGRLLIGAAACIVGLLSAVFALRI